MLPLIILGFAIGFAIIARVLLLVDAFKISAGWGFGVLLPFGPLFFRLNYPDEARRSMIFRLATVVCVMLYVIVGPGPAIRNLKRQKVRQEATRQVHPGDYVYAIEKRAITPAKRRAANDKEMARLQAWAEELKTQKRDLLHSDVEGNRLYAADLALYNDALAKATAERKEIDGAPNSKADQRKPTDAAKK